MKTVLDIQGTTGIYKIVAINNNLKCNCKAAQSGELCKHIIALFAGNFSAVTNREAIKEIKPILARHPALADFQQIKKLRKEKREIEQKRLELEQKKNKIDDEIKPLKKSVARKLYANQ